MAAGDCFPRLREGRLAALLAMTEIGSGRHCERGVPSAAISWSHCLRNAVVGNWASGEITWLSAWALVGMTWSRMQLMFRDRAPVIPAWEVFVRVSWHARGSVKRSLAMGDLCAAYGAARAPGVAPSPSPLDLTLPPWSRRGTGSRCRRTFTRTLGVCVKTPWHGCVIRIPRRGRPPCLPSSLKAIRCWAWRARATTGGCPYGRARLCVAKWALPEYLQRHPWEGIDEMCFIWRRAGLECRF